MPLLTRVLALAEATPETLGLFGTVLVLLGNDGPVELPEEFRAALETVLLRA